MLQARETQAGPIRILVVDDDLYARQAMMEDCRAADTR